MMSTASADPGERLFLGTAALLFASGVAVTVHECMAMSMPWMPMPGQSWPRAAAAFLGMWVAMMIAMMLPSLLPMLRRYRRSLGRAAETDLDPLTALVAVGYFAVWSAFGPFRSW
jgi:predicted metal-binding membrane protein